MEGIEYLTKTEQFIFKKIQCEMKTSWESKSKINYLYWEERYKSYLERIKKRKEWFNK